MEQQQLSITANQINEGYSLGERYHLGALQGEYYVAYTQADMRRYRFHVFLIAAMVLYALIIIGYLAYLVSPVYNTPNRFFPIGLFPILINPFAILYRNAQRRKWGNRPIITPRNRHLRVYVYQYGLVKQTNQKSEALRWLDLSSIKYEPLEPAPQKPSTTAKPMAGIKLVLSDKRKIHLNGALRNLDSLAKQLDGKNLANKIPLPKVHY